jgi:hypothetical protein
MPGIFDTLGAAMNPNQPAPGALERNTTEANSDAYNRTMIDKGMVRDPMGNWKPKAVSPPPPPTAALPPITPIAPNAPPVSPVAMPIQNAIKRTPNNLEGVEGQFTPTGGMLSGRG